MSPPTQPESPSEPTSREQSANIGFVDILFALVVGSALDALTRVRGMSAAGRTHLAFASLLTIMSWVGYHNSAHGYTGTIKFDLRDLPAFTAAGKLLIDIGLVVAYWLAVRTTELGFAGSSDIPSWRPTAILSVASFIGYVLWDLLSWRAPRRDGKQRSAYCSWRRMVSLLFAALVFLLALATWSSHPSGDWPVTTVNLVVCVLVVAYRFAKDSEPARYQSWYKSKSSAAASD